MATNLITLILFPQSKWLIVYLDKSQTYVSLCTYVHMYVCITYRVIQKCPYMGSMISLFTKCVLYGHHGHPTRRMTSTRSFRDTCRYVTEKIQLIPIYGEFWVIPYVYMYSQGRHKYVSVNDGPHTRGWSQKIILWYNNIILTIVLQLPPVFSTVTCCTGL